MPSYSKRHSVGLGSHCDRRNVNSPLKSVVQDLTVSYGTEDGVAQTAAGDQLPVMPSTWCYVERPPESTEPVLQQQRRVLSGGSITGTHAESEKELNFGSQSHGGQQQHVVVDNPVEGSLARLDVRAGWQSVGPGTRRMGAKYNVDTTLIIDVGHRTGGVSSRPARVRKAPIRLQESDRYQLKTKLNSKIVSGFIVQCLILEFCAIFVPDSC